MSGPLYRCTVPRLYARIVLSLRHRHHYRNFARSVQAGVSRHLKYIKNLIFLNVNEPIEEQLQRWSANNGSNYGFDRWLRHSFGNGSNQIFTDWQSVRDIIRMFPKETLRTFR